MLYGSDITWKAGELNAFLAFNRLCSEQAKAIHAWDAASIRGNVSDQRPEIVPAAELAMRARAA